MIIESDACHTREIRCNDQKDEKNHENFLNFGRLVEPFCHLNVSSKRETEETD